MTLKKWIQSYGIKRLIIGIEKVDTGVAKQNQ